MKRAGQAGVTLVEMLVVLVIFGITAGAVVLALPSGQRAAGPEAQALAFAADLDRAIDLVLLRQRGFGIQHADGTLRFVEENQDGAWLSHSEETLGALKLSGTRLRSSLEEGATFEVSDALVPKSSDALQVTFSTGPRVTFDGARVRIEEGTDARRSGQWLQPD